MKQWLMMGVELEGGWNATRATVVENVLGAESKEDGSVRTRGVDNGEIITRPHNTLKKLCEDVVKLYPQHVDASCGLHVHTSFTPMAASLLTDRAFWEFYRTRWNDWAAAQDGRKLGSFWDRYNGLTPGLARNGDAYCKAEFKPAQQLGLQKDRYTQLNFCAWQKYKTLESRLLPMFKDPELAVLAIQETASIYDDWLTDRAFPDILGEENLIITPDGSREEYLVELPSLAPKEETFADVIPRLPRGEGQYYMFRGAENLVLPYVTEVDGDDSMDPPEE